MQEIFIANIITNFKLAVVNTKNKRLGFFWPHFFSGRMITKAYLFIVDSIKYFYKEYSLYYALGCFI